MVACLHLFGGVNDGRELLNYKRGSRRSQRDRHLLPVIGCTTQIGWTISISCKLLHWASSLPFDINQLPPHRNWSGSLHFKHFNFKSTPIRGELVSPYYISQLSYSKGFNKQKCVSLFFLFIQEFCNNLFERERSIMHMHYGVYLTWFEFLPESAFFLLI
jgi:hypothetical protein